MIRMPIRKTTKKLESNRLKRTTRKFEWLSKSLEDRNEALFSKYVPDEGKADTFGGELLRAMNIVCYNWNNDGDSVRWGQPHVRNAALFLADNDRWGLGVENLIEEDENLEFYNDSKKLNDDRYDRRINSLAEDIIDILEDEPELFEDENYEDCTEGYWTWQNLDEISEPEEEYEEEDWDDEDDEDDEEYNESRKRLECRKFNLKKKHLNR